MKPLCEVCNTRHESYQGHVFPRTPSRVTTEVVKPPAAKRAVVDTVVVDAPKVVDMVVDSVSHAKPVVVDDRSGDRHRKTAERREYLRVKQRESRVRRAARRVSA